MIYCWKVCREKADLLSRIIEINHNWKMDCSHQTWIHCDKLWWNFFLCNCFIGWSLVVVDKTCGITSCGVWCLEQKIGFDPRFFTFELRFPAKRTNIKRDLTRPQGLYTQLYKRQKKSKKSDPATNFIPFARGKSNTNFTGLEKSVLFLFP